MYDAQHSTAPPPPSPASRPSCSAQPPAPTSPTTATCGTKTTPCTPSIPPSTHSPRDIARDGTQLADERESFLWGFVNLFHAQVNRLDRAVDALKPKLRDLERAQDGTEINAHELERTVDRARALGDRRDAFEKMRDHAAGAYRTETGSTWRPRRGSHVSQTGEAHLGGHRRPRLPPCPRAPRQRGAPARRDPRRGRRRQGGGQRRRHLHHARPRQGAPPRHGPGARRGTGGGAHRRALGRQQRGAPGGVQARLERPRPRGSLPRNDQLLKLLPTGLVAFPGNGITENLVDKARELGIPVLKAHA